MDFVLTCCSKILRAFLTFDIFGERIGRVLISPGVRALRSPTVLMFLARTSCPNPRNLRPKSTTALSHKKHCLRISVRNRKLSPHGGGYLGQHRLHGSRAADQGGIDAVFGHSSRFLTHFRNLEKSAGDSSPTDVVQTGMKTVDANVLWSLKVKLLAKNCRLQDF